MKLGELLIENGLIVESQLEKALEAQKVYGGKLGTNLVELGFISELDLAKFLAQQLSMLPCSPLEFDEIQQTAVDAVPRKFIAEYRVMPLSIDEALRIAISDPRDLDAVKRLGQEINKEVEVVIAPEVWIVAALERYYQIPREQRYVSPELNTESFQDALVDNSVAIEVSPQEPLKKGTISLSDYANGLLQKRTAVEILTSLLQFLTPVFPQMAIYAIRPEEISGWVLSGFPVRNKDFVNNRIPLTEPSIIKMVIESGEVFRGTIPKTEANERLFGILNITKDKGVGLYPIPFRNKIIGMLLGIPGSELGAPVPQSGNLVPDAINRAGVMLEVLYLMKRIVDIPQSISAS